MRGRIAPLGAAWLVCLIILGSTVEAGAHRRRVRALPKHRVEASPSPQAAPPSKTVVSLEEAIRLSGDPEQRARGIAMLELLVGVLADPRPARVALARALSWDEKYAPAIALYDELLRQPGHADEDELRLERAQVLSWQGKTAAAEDAFKALVRARPELVAAWIGLARVRRWQGHSIAAGDAAERAVALDPRSAEAREELAWAYAETGRARRAERVLDGERPSLELSMRLQDRRRPELGVAGAVSGNSFGVLRVAPRAIAQVSLPRDLDLLLVGGATYLSQNADQYTYGVVGARLALALPHVQLFAGVAGYFGHGTTQYDALGTISVRPHDAFSFSIGARHRTFMEVADPFVTDERIFHGAGVGGAQLLGQALSLGVDEVSASLNLAPWRWFSVYADWRGMKVNDGNLGHALSAGLDVNPLRIFGDPPIELHMQWDVFLTGYQHEQPVYYSPKLLFTQSVGPELRAHLSVVEVSAQGGAVITEDRVGWYAGGSFGLKVRRVTIAARGDYRHDEYFQSWRAWAQIDARL